MKKSYPIIAMACLISLPYNLFAKAPASLAKSDEITFVDTLKTDSNDRIVLEGFIRHAVEYAENLTQAKLAKTCSDAPEMFAWVEFKYLNCLNISYELTHDTKYLDMFGDSFAMCRNIMSTGPDKYLGWYGSPIKPRIPADNPTIRIDELQMNFRAMSILAKWVELARSDSEYAAKNADIIVSYIDLMENHLFPKWDQRGHFTEIPGRGGVYHGLDYPIEGQVTLSHEKLSIMLDGLLKLHRVTQNDIYLKRALQIGAWFKSNLTLKEGHYEWMSWVPAGKWDISTQKEDAWQVGWIAPDPNAQWYITSLSIALSLYQHGLLFDETDLQRFIRTQKTMCWNGDMEKPVYRNVAAQTSKWIKGRFLSHQLANYDPLLAKLAFDGPHEAETLKNAANSWHGCANAQSYVTEKFIMAPIVAKNPQPFAETGKKFLAKPDNREFYDKLFFEVKAPGAKTPLKPSEMFGKE